MPVAKIPATLLRLRMWDCDLVEFGVIAFLVVGVLLWWVGRHRTGRNARPRPVDRVGSRVMVAVSHPSSAPGLGELAAALAAPDDGHVEVLTVVECGAGPDQRGLAAETVKHGSDVVAGEGIEASSQVRVDATFAHGVLHRCVEWSATLAITGWPQVGPGGGLAPAFADAIKALPAPLLLARLQGHRWERVLLRVPPGTTEPGHRASLRFATEVAERVAAARRLPVVCVSDGEPGSRELTSQLAISAVPPVPGALEDAVLGAEALGDLLVAMCHGPEAAEHRELLPSAARLYEPS